MLDITFIKESLLNKTFVSWVYYFDELASTNDFAKKINGHDNVLIISEYQYSGKGRYGRNWKSEKGSNLTFTIKKKFGVSPEQNSYLNFYFTYFLYKALQRFLNENFPKLKTDSLEIKWPNDILFDSKKICGILIETSKSNSLIVGVGLNVNQQSFDDDLRAASLINFTSQQINLNNLLVEIINEFSSNFHLLIDGKFDQIYGLWRNSSKLIGKTVEFRGEGDYYKSAKIIDLMENGSIKLLVDETEKIYNNGEIKLKL